jgi:cytochrome c biogenesis protein CcmG/thiol:disulfide interchange protein DsbE
MKLRFLLPLAVLAALLMLFALALGRDPRQLPSPLVGRLAPAFEAPVLGAAGGGTLGSGALKGSVWVLNVWASWCAACRDEHGSMLELARRQVPLYGLNYKDMPQAAQDWLQRSGDPYRASIVDEHGHIGMDYGVYGVPETFVIDAGGVVRYRRAGPVTPTILQQEILPLIAQLQS